MKLATLNNGTRDGELIVVNKALSHFISAKGIAPTMQFTIDQWAQVKPKLEILSQKLNKQEVLGESLVVSNLLAPLPRAYQWLDGSAYLSHVARVRKARGAEMLENFKVDPLMYQGGSDSFLAPCQDIPLVDENMGLDFEAEIAVITDDVPINCSKEEAAKHIILIGLVNDVSLRNEIPQELAKGFGFLQSKPSSAFAPVFITPDELGSAAWDGVKLNGTVICKVNKEWFGAPQAGKEMQFNFAQLIAHAAKTRPLGAGTIIGSGTVSNEQEAAGYACIMERRSVEIAKQGQAITSYLKFGDFIDIEVLDSENHSVFGAISQKVASQL